MNAFTQTVPGRSLAAATRFVVLLWFVPSFIFGDEPKSTAIHVGSKFAATDTLACGDESSDDAKECLAKLSWAPQKFTVRLDAVEHGSFGDYLVRFPSARPIGNSVNDLVAMEWYAARGADHAIRRARAIVVVHESGSQMSVGRLIARNLSGQGLHAFLVELPGYGARRVPEFSTAERLIPSMQQGIADVRRARDAVVAIPAVDRSVVGLQGTSLGGFVAATVAGLDHGYDRVFILLAGGNLQEVLFNGSKEVTKARIKLAAAGVSNDQIREFAREVEPLRLAHRIHPNETWLYSGQLDKVVPPKNSLALAKAARLPEGHHIKFDADHYLGIVYLPQAIGEITKQMTGPAGAPAQSSAKPAGGKIEPALVQVDEDPDLPRVLLIGDSITMGYTPALREILAKKANVQHPTENCGPSRRILEHLDLYLGKKPWDVIQLNCGIHDLTYRNEAGEATGPNEGGKQQVPIDEYRSNLEKIVARLKMTGAKLVWCTTTPLNHPGPHRIPADVDRYNEVAKEVMEKNGVRMNDLNREVHSWKRPMWTPGGVHFTPDGYRRLAEAAAPIIEAALPKPK